MLLNSGHRLYCNIMRWGQHPCPRMLLPSTVPVNLPGRWIGPRCCSQGYAFSTFARSAAGILYLDAALPHRWSIVVYCWKARAHNDVCTTWRAARRRLRLPRRSRRARRARSSKEVHRGRPAAPATRTSGCYAFRRYERLATLRGAPSTFNMPQPLARVGTHEAHVQTQLSHRNICAPIIIRCECAPCRYVCQY